MFHLQPGTGVGFSGSREMALGLGGISGVVPPIIPPDIVPPSPPDGVGTAGSQFPSDGSDPTKHAPSARQRRIKQQILDEDKMIVEVLRAFVQVINQ